MYSFNMTQNKLPAARLVGFLELFVVVPCRKDLNNPPTAVGGILPKSNRRLSRKDLNNPPTSVGGISSFGIGGITSILLSLLRI
jgi:hypothetical protein